MMSSPSSENSTSAVAEIYDAFSSEYRNYSQQKSRYISAVDDLIVDLFKGKSDRMLDFGAGDGVRGAGLKERLKSNYLVQSDISSEMMARCEALGGADQVWGAQASWPETTGSFDLIVCLWNVLGHVPDRQSRVGTLKRLRSLMHTQGRLCFDVNNRHNRVYGKTRIVWRRVVDFIRPDERRGDAVFDWTINGVVYPAYGHLFTFNELQKLLKDASLEIESWRSVDYLSGEVFNRVDRGHLFFVVKKMELEGES